MLFFDSVSILVHYFNVCLSWVCSLILLTILPTFTNMYTWLVFLNTNILYIYLYFYILKHIWYFKFSFGILLVPTLVTELNKIFDTFKFLFVWGYDRVFFWGKLSLFLFLIFNRNPHFEIQCREEDDSLSVFLYERIFLFLQCKNLCMW